MTRWTIVLPTLDNDGNDIPKAHDTLQRYIAKSGGYTARPSVGHWPGPSGRVYSENVIEYVFDRPDDALSNVHVDAIATIARIQAGQEGVYVTRQDVTAWVI